MKNRRLIQNDNELPATPLTSETLLNTKMKSGLDLYQYAENTKFSEKKIHYWMYRRTSKVT